MPFCPHCRLFFGEDDEIHGFRICSPPRMCCEEEESNPEEKRPLHKLDIPRLSDAGYTAYDISILILKNKNPDLRD